MVLTTRLTVLSATWKARSTRPNAISKEATEWIHFTK